MYDSSVRPQTAAFQANMMGKTLSLYYKVNGMFRRGCQNHEIWAWRTLGKKSLPLNAVYQRNCMFRRGCQNHEIWAWRPLGWKSLTLYTFYIGSGMFRRGCQNHEIWAWMPLCWKSLIFLDCHWSSFILLIFIEFHGFDWFASNFNCIFIDFIDFHWYLRFSMIFIDFLWFSLIFFDFHGFSLIFAAPRIQTTRSGGGKKDCSQALLST